MLVRSRDELTSDLAEVEGWLLPGEAWALYRVVLDKVGQVDCVTVVELGSWKGRSTIALASALPMGHGTVYAVDPHMGDDGDKQVVNQSQTYEEFHANIERAGVTDRVRPLRETSHQARARFSARSVDVLFVDASHRYKDVLQDIDDWSSTLREGSTVAFNDVFGDGVSKALRKRVLVHRSPYRRPRVVDNTMLVEYVPSVPWQAADDLALGRMRAGVVLERRWLKIKPKVPQRLAHALRPLRRIVS